MNTTIRRPKSLIALAMAILLAAAISVVSAPPASADSDLRISFTGIGIYPRSEPSMGAAKVGKALADGTRITVTCETTGEAVTSSAGTSTIWEKLNNGSYVPNVFVETGVNGWTPGIPQCEAAKPTTFYNRQAAADYAKANYTGLNVDRIAKCTYFASAVLEAGGINTTSAWTPESTKLSRQASRILFALQGGVGPTTRWAHADSLKNYLVNERKIATITEVPLSAKNPGADLGDLVAFDWPGQSPGVIDHLAVVTGFAPDGTLLVTQKEDDFDNKPWNWSGSAGMAILDSNPGTRAYVIHITY